MSPRGQVVPVDEGAVDVKEHSGSRDGLCLAGRHIGQESSSPLAWWYRRSRDSLAAAPPLVSWRRRERPHRWPKAAEQRGALLPSTRPPTPPFVAAALADRVAGAVERSVQPGSAEKAALGAVDRSIGAGIGCSVCRSRHRKHRGGEDARDCGALGPLPHAFVSFVDSVNRLPTCSEPSVGGVVASDQPDWPFWQLRPARYQIGANVHRAQPFLLPATAVGLGQPSSEAGLPSCACVAGGCSRSCARQGRPPPNGRSCRCSDRLPSGRARLIIGVGRSLADHDHARAAPRVTCPASAGSRAWPTAVAVRARGPDRVPARPGSGLFRRGRSPPGRSSRCIGPLSVPPIREIFVRHAGPSRGAGVGGPY